MNIHNNDWSTRTINSRLSLLYVVAYPASIRMNDEDFIAGSYQFLKDLRTYQPRSVLLNLRGFQFTISPDIQDWMVDNIFPFVEILEIEKIAIVASLDALCHLSVQQTIEEDDATDNITRYFEGETTARRWLLQEEPVGTDYF